MLTKLKKMNCSTQRVKDGQTAVDLLRDSVRGTFDLILMDLKMPMKDGIEAIKMIRRYLRMADLPIIILTEELSADVRSQCEAVGVDGFLGKPLKGDHLHNLVETYRKARYG